MLTDFRQEFARAVGLRHIVITAGRPRDLLLSVERLGGDPNPAALHFDDALRYGEMAGSVYCVSLTAGLLGQE